MPKDVCTLFYSEYIVAFARSKLHENVYKEPKTGKRIQVKSKTICELASRNIACRPRG